MSVADQISSATGSVGVVLVLLSLFTAEQSRRNEFETDRIGGPRRSVTSATRRFGWFLAVATSLAFLALVPLGVRVIESCCSGAWRGDQAVFLLLWLLMLPLVGWQVAIARQATRLSGLDGPK